jgi:hypothetical protein
VARVAPARAMKHLPSARTSSRQQPRTRVSSPCCRQSVSLSAHLHSGPQLLRELLRAPRDDGERAGCGRWRVWPVEGVAGGGCGALRAPRALPPACACAVARAATRAAKTRCPHLQLRGTHVQGNAPAKARRRCCWLKGAGRRLLRARRTASAHSERCALCLACRTPCEEPGLQEMCP